MPLFAGLTLTGWEGDPTIFRVADGAIVGGSLKQAVGRGKDFLCTKRSLRDCASPHHCTFARSTVIDHGRNA